MSKIDEYIAKRSKKSSDFAGEYKEENQKLQVAAEVRNFRDKLQYKKVLDCTIKK